MSAICGVFERGGAPADRGAAEVMLAAMAHRAPDGCGTWRGGPVALGLGLLRNAPEPTAPEVIGDDALRITADVRLDNRDELIPILGLQQDAPDIAVVLAAYGRWGEDCPAHLLGDFAFAVWDVGRQTMFCARDHFGVKPFYYRLDEAGFVFASEPKAFEALTHTQPEVEELAVAEFLAGMWPDAQATFHRELNRLAPAHRLIVTAAGQRLECWWRLEPGPAPIEVDAPTRFRELFEVAVQRRLRSARPIGAMLSGGLDSSFIAGMAAILVRDDGAGPLPTLSMVFDETPAWNERPFQEAVLAGGGFEPTFIAMDGAAPFAEFDTVLSEQDFPFLAPSLTLSRQIYRRAAGLGIGVVLDGHGGDEVVSFGEGRLIELAQAGRWMSLWREIDGLVATGGASRFATFRAYALAFGPGRGIRDLARSVKRRLAPARPPQAGPPAWRRFVHPNLAAQTRLDAHHADRQRNSAGRARNERDRHLAILASDVNSYAFEVLDRQASAVGIEARYPFWDKDLVEFCLSLPAEEKLKDGWSRLVMRRAMEGVLPPAIQWRRDKLDFSPHLIRGMLGQHRELLDQLVIEDVAGLDGLVDMPAVVAAYQRLIKQAEAADGYDVQAVWRTAVLALWLRGIGKRMPAHRSAA